MGKAELDAANWRPAKDGDTARCATCKFYVRVTEASSSGWCDRYDARTRRDYVSDGYQPVQGGESSMLSELYFDGAAEADVVEEDGLIWKPILRTGTWALTPDLDGNPIEKELKVVTGDAGEDEISIDAIKSAFDDGAIPHVTVPLTHKDRPDENTGYIRQLRIDKGDDVDLLMGGFEFTEPDIKQKAKNKSIPNSSAGLLFNYRRKSDGKTFPIALAHCALTSKPWMHGLEGFGALAASQNIDFDHVQGLVFSDGVEGDSGGGDNGDEPADTDVWQESDSLEWRRDAAQRSLQTIMESTREQAPEGMIDSYFSIRDITPDRILIQEDGGTKGAYVAGYTVGGDGIELDPRSQWTAAKQEWVAASEDTLTEVEPRRLPGSLSLAEARKARKARLGARNDNANTSKGGDTVGHTPEGPEKLALDEVQDENKRLREENARLAAEGRRNKVEDRVKEYGEMGLDQHPGFLKRLRTIMLSDDGEPALLLSEDEGSRRKGDNLTATEIVEFIVDGLPKKDDKIVLSEQINKDDDHDRPPEDASKEKSTKEKADEAVAALQGGES